MKRGLRVAALAAIGAGLLYLLVRHSGLTPAAVIEAGARVPLPVLMSLTLLLGANLALCTVKWLLAMRALAPDHRPQPRFLDAMLATTLGALFGQVMPFQIGVSLARAAAGLSGVGSPGLNLGATLYEQLFDLIVLAAAASVGLAGLTLHCGAVGWLALALAGGGAGLLAALRLARLLDAAARLLPAVRCRRLTALLVDAAGRAVQIPPSISLRLIAFSALRYASLVGWAAVLLHALGMSAFVAAAATALPLLQVVAILPIAPGGLGIAEWTWTAVLAGAGATLSAAAMFAVVARVLTILLLGVLLLALAAACLIRSCIAAATADPRPEISSPGSG